MIEKKRTAIIENIDAFYAFLSEQPLLRASNNPGAARSLEPLSQHGDAKKPVQSEEDLAFAQALKDMV